MDKVGFVLNHEPISINNKSHKELEYDLLNALT